jgi:hypothetical protein
MPWGKKWRRHEQFDTDQGNREPDEQPTPENSSADSDEGREAGYGRFGRHTIAFSNRIMAKSSG